MTRWRRGPALLALALALQAGPELLACSFAQIRDERVIARITSDHIRRAAAVVDGEVVRPLVPGVHPARVRAHRVLRGPRQAFFEIGERSSCDMVLMSAGARIRLVLYGGPELYFAPLSLSDPRMEDLILRSDRNRVWPYFPGEENPGAPPAPRGD